jgi:uncharacterized protein (DUF1015 family)
VARFLPFRGILYDQALAGALTDLICPPYDIISPQEKLLLQKRSPYNMVNLELSETEGPPSPDQYSIAAELFRAWQAQGILKRDSVPAYYLLQQRFESDGSLLDRHSLIGVLELGEWGQSILPHEHTGTAAKEDRYALMSAAKANFSPLMGLFGDRSNLISSLRDWAKENPPIGKIVIAPQIESVLWRITTPSLIDLISSSLEDQTVYMADGHHRYETALKYTRDGNAQTDPEQANQFVLMSLIALDDPGLLILPYHRIIRKLDPEMFSQIRDRIAQVFTVEPLSPDIVSTNPITQIMQTQPGMQPFIGLMLREPNNREDQSDSCFLSGPDPLFVERYVPSGKEAALRNDPNWVLEEVILRPLLGDTLPNHIAYTHDPHSAIDEVNSGHAQFAFFMNRIPATVFESFVGSGIRLPRKSTYFQPKLPSGLVINTLEGAL